MDRLLGTILIVGACGLAGCSVTTKGVVDAGAQVCKVTPAVRVAAEDFGYHIPAKVTVIRGEICDMIAKAVGK